MVHTLVYNKNVICIYLIPFSSYSLIVLHMYVMQPAEVIVSLQEAGQLLVCCYWLRQQLPSLAFLHVPAEQEVSEVLEETGRAVSKCIWHRYRKQL